MAKIKIYRYYDYTDKAPVIGVLKEIVVKENLHKKPGIVAEISNLSRNTIVNLFDGPTRNPRYSTVMALIGPFGYEAGEFRKVRKFDLENERKLAARWLEKQEAKQKAAKEKLIAARKAARAAAADGTSHGKSLF